LIRDCLTKPKENCEKDHAPTKKKKKRKKKRKPKINQGKYKINKRTKHNLGEFLT